MARHRQPLIPAEEGKFEAWTHGPVLPFLYATLKSEVANTWGPLPVPERCPVLPGEVTEHLQEVYDVYGGYSEFELGCIACSENPWRSARKGLAPDEVVKGRVIGEDDMISFYGKLLRQGNAMD